jgi:hypothetical protein
MLERCASPAMIDGVELGVAVAAGVGIGVADGVEEAVGDGDGVGEGEGDTVVEHDTTTSATAAHPPARICIGQLCRTGRSRATGVINSSAEGTVLRHRGSLVRILTL